MLYIALILKSHPILVKNIYDNMYHTLGGSLEIPRGRVIKAGQGGGSNDRHSVRDEYGYFFKQHTETNVSVILNLLHHLFKTAY